MSKVVIFDSTAATSSGSRNSLCGSQYSRRSKNSIRGIDTFSFVFVFALYGCNNGSESSAGTNIQLLCFCRCVRPAVRNSIALCEASGGKTCAVSLADISPAGFPMLITSDLISDMIDFDLTEFSLTACATFAAATKSLRRAAPYPRGRLVSAGLQLPRVATAWLRTPPTADPTHTHLFNLRSFLSLLLCSCLCCTIR